MINNRSKALIRIDISIETNRDAINNAMETGVLKVAA